MSEPKKKRSNEKKKIYKLYQENREITDEDIDQLLQEEAAEQADDIEAMLDEDPDVAKIQVPKGMFDRIVGSLKDEGLWEDDEDETEQENIENENRTEEIAEEIAIEVGKDIQGKEKIKEEIEEEKIQEQKSEVLDKEAIIQMLPEKEQRALKEGMHRLETAKLRKRIKKMAVVAAALVCVVVMGLSSEASRRYIMNIWAGLTTGRELVLRVSDKDSGETALAEEEAFRIAREELKLKPVELLYKPENMDFLDYDLDKVNQKINYFYNYNGKIFSIFIYRLNKSASFAHKIDGKILESYQNIILYDKDISYDLWECEAGSEKSYVAEFTYNDSYYCISGIVEIDEFKKIMENISII